MVFKSRGNMSKEKMLKICLQRIEKVHYFYLGCVFRYMPFTYVTFCPCPREGRWFWPCSTAGGGAGWESHGAGAGGGKRCHGSSGCSGLCRHKGQGTDHPFRNKVNMVWHFKIPSLCSAGHQPNWCSLHIKGEAQKLCCVCFFISQPKQL